MSCPPQDRPNWPFDVNHTEEQLAEMRIQALLELKQHGVDEFTCDTCKARNICDLVFDGYNTNGDCLAEK